MKLTKQLGTKALSMFLAILMILSTLPLTIFASNIDTSTPSSDDDYSVNLIKNAFEVEELRSETVKHFRLEDGTYVAAQYDKPIHYQDTNGEWKDIDNTLDDTGSDISTSNARIKFAKKITGNNVLFTLHENNHKITMSLDGAITLTNTKSLCVYVGFMESPTTRKGRTANKHRRATIKDITDITAIQTKRLFVLFICHSQFINLQQ